MQGKKTTFRKLENAGLILKSARGAVRSLAGKAVKKMIGGGK